MNISLNPSYHCNLRCDFCYLGDKLGDSTKIDLAVLDQRLSEVRARGPIEHVDLYGGEVTILPEDYLDELFKVVKRHYDGPVNIITNLTNLSPVLFRDDVDLSVSFDFEARKGFEKTLRHLAMVDKPVAVLMLASQKLISLDLDYMIRTLNAIQSIQSVEIKPYSTNQYNQQPVTFRQFEQFVQSFLTHPTKLRPVFVNEHYIQDSLEGTRNAFSDNHIYITPSGKFGVLEFDKNDNEFFLELDSYADYERWTLTEKLRVRSNAVCASCEYFGRCLTEHYRNVVDLKESCNGFKFLLEWYKNERMEAPPENLSRAESHR